LVYNKKKDYTGIGIIVRDSVGYFLGARSFTQQIEVESKVAEAIAALSAVMFSKEVSFFYVILEGNALQIIQ
jgi:hypothetical protein